MKRAEKLFRILTRPQLALALLRYRVPGSVEHCAVLSQLTCRSVIDIGANRGQFSLATKNCMPDAKIVAFEPLSGPASVYRRLFEKDKTVILHEAAIGSESGSSTIHISHRDDSSSLLPITERQNALFPGTSEAATAKIRVGPLREFVSENDIRAPALLKLDVQGYELEVLRGSDDLLHEFEFIYAECSFVELYHGQAMANEIIEHLAKRGFGLHGVHNVSYDRNGMAIQADFLFKNGSSRK